MKKILRSTLVLILLSAFLVSINSCNKRNETPRVLVFSKASGYVHESIPAGVAAIIKLGKENNFNVDTTSDANWFNEDSLKNYSAVIFISTTDTADVLLNNYQQADFERFIQAGGGFVGIHAATDAMYHWGWYDRLIGANFKSHPEQQQATLNIVDPDHISTKGLPNPWIRKDEWYNFKNMNKDVHVLITIDEKSYKGGENGEHHPMSWYHDYDGGRAWYTELGHTTESYTEPNFLKHLLGGIQYAIGDNKELNYSKATTQRVPEEERFVKTQLVQATFTEPTEMTVLPNLDILIVERRGQIMLYKNKDKTVRQIDSLHVYWKSSAPGVNAEEGLMGVHADPDFQKNHFVYMYYSPSDTSVNRLSRFTLDNDAIDLKSEKIILQLYSQRDICCHTGGSVAFGKDRMLFVSTGDNSTPFDEPKQTFVNHGYAPLNDDAGHLQYDARRSAGNTNDLRGKILRIKINEDGSYAIPDGNLFAKGTDKTRPEIYVMGDRNPYRISVDQKNGFLYWGEVGPDAPNDSLETRGPRGYDEVNQARKAGFFGWPLFVGNNYPYHKYNYTTGETGPAFDTANPVNDSRNNTGLQKLPKPQPAFIWYPYSYTEDFPQVGTGGRNAMAGPVYYTDMYPKETRYPDYYNKKLFTYDWIRGWIKVITMRENGDFDKMEPFMEHTTFNSLIDFEVGPDGKFYGLEYGTGWFTKNPDAGLFRIDYNVGNIPPKVTSLSVDKISGALPFTVHANVKANDVEKSKLTYVWNLGNGKQLQTSVPSADYTYTTPGDYAISVEVKDDKNAIGKSDAVSVYAGNEAPSVNIDIVGNKTFYFPGLPVKYNVTITDKDDTSKVKDLTNLIVTADYKESTDKAATTLGHKVLTDAEMGKNNILSLDCKSCHKIDEKSIGPAFSAVAERYKKKPDATAYLVSKIIKGGSGVWGEVAMSAHPNLKENDAKQIVAYILSLNASKEKIKSLPASGTLNPTLNKPVKDSNSLYISATYTDKGGINIKPLTGNNTVQLRSAKLTFENIKNMQGFSKFSYNNTTYLILPASGWFSIDSIDLTGIKGFNTVVGWQNPPISPYSFEVHLDSPNGEKLGELTFAGDAGKPVQNTQNAKPNFKILSTNISLISDSKLHNLYVIATAKDKNSVGNAALAFIQFFMK